jgi:tRNA(Ile)-lysidine synthase
MKILDTIAKNFLIKEGDTVGIAVSGGADSVALLHFLNDRRDELKIKIYAVNIDHNLRKNSKKDSEFVEVLCKRFGIYFKGFFVDVPALRAVSGRGVEEEARRARYGIFERLIKDGAATSIATAHHMSDQAETVLLNLFRGSGQRGACGISYRRGGIIRPLLDTSKDEILSYVKAQKIKFVSDETNLKNDRSRNYVRNVIMPKIEKRFGSAAQNIVRYSKLASIDDDYINGKITELPRVTEGAVSIPLSCFKEDDALIGRTIFKAFNMLNVYSNVEYKHIGDIKKLALKGGAGSRIDLKNVAAYRDYDCVSIRLNDCGACGVHADVTADFRIPFKREKTRLPKCLIDITEVARAEVDFKNGLNALYIDAERIPPSAVWRRRGEGDIFKGINAGSKKLKKYLIDKKIPRRRRDMPVLADGGNILLIAGVELSDGIKINNSTKSIIKITLEENNKQ